MAFPSIARAVARAISSPTLFGEAVTYRRADGTTLVLEAVVGRQPPGIEFAGSLGTTQLVGTVLVRREDLQSVSTGRDTVTLEWTNGAMRTATIREIVQVSESFWRLGFQW